MSTDSIQQRLKKAQQELLDLTGRNRLLNIPKGASKWGVKVVDTTAEVVFENLVERERKLRFAGLGTLDEPEDVDDEDVRRAPGMLFGDEDHVIEFSSSRDDLPVRLKKDALDKRLLKLQLQARTFEEEQGVNILYLAVGFLQWFEDDNSDTPRSAPLILVPVVLDRSNVRAKYTLAWSGEDIATNLTLKVKLQSDFGLNLPEIGDREDLNVADYLNRVQDVVGGKKRWVVQSDEILLWFFSFSKYLMYRDLEDEGWGDGKGPSNHPIVGGLIGGGFGGAAPLCGDGENIDPIIQPIDMVHILDADSSQAIVVEEVRRGRNLVVQGPPWTGKSQTIANIIATAVKDGKRVLFVSEKMAALEVVKARFDNLQMGEICLELHSHKTNKKAVLAELDKTLKLGAPKAEIAERQIEELQRVRDRLNAHCAILHTPLEPSKLTPYQIIGRLTKLNAEGVKITEYLGPEVVKWSPETFRTIRNLLSDVIRHQSGLGDPQRHPWRGVHLDAPPLPSDLQRHSSTLRIIIEELAPLIEGLNRIVQSLSLDSQPSFSESAALLKLSQHLVNAPELDISAITHAAWKSKRDEIANLVREGAKHAAERAGLEQDFADVAWTTHVSGARRAIAAHGKSWFRFFNGSYRTALATFRGILRDDSIPRAHRERIVLLDKLMAAQERLSLLRSENDSTAAARNAFGSNWKGADSDWDLLARIDSWERQGREIKSPLDFRRLLATSNDSALSNELVQNVRNQLKPVYDRVQRLFDVFRINVQEAFGTDDLRRIPLVDLQSRFRLWTENAEELSKWVHFDLRIEELRRQGTLAFADAVNQGLVSPDSAMQEFEISYFDQLIRHARQERPDLARFDGMTHEQLQKSFRGLDRQRITMARLEVLLAHHRNMPTSQGDFGEVGTIRRELGKKRKLKPIRALLSEAGRAVQLIKPVFMMSPMSVAQYLEPGKLEFDMLVIDEASQVKPVDALGAVARSRQIVVVGDDKQLPPTSFFDRITASDDDSSDDNNVAADVESILGLCSSQGMLPKMLEWHYRSRHHSLIAVSNYEFYDSRLFVIPHPNNAEGIGLVFRHIPHGIYDSGGSRSNEIEAKAVAAAIMEHANRTPHKNLGVGTFSEAQRDAIINELEILRRAHPEHESFFSQEKPHPFFVKNLENIQGDEREFIYISIGYGRDATGRVSMNFGPLNKEGGHRRLNVLISRASEQCVVFSSITADDIDLSRTQSRGVKAFKTFLKYAQHRQLEIATPSGESEDSEFERQVRKELTNLGHNVEPQIGMAGFRIDLAVVDPHHPGRYLLGIECDGATYHSSRSARDRDRLRQQILESREWIIHRIWSTDWFQRPQEQLRKTVEAIERAKIEWARRDAAPPEVPRSQTAGNEPIIDRVEPNTSNGDNGFAQSAEPYIEANINVSQLNCDEIHSVSVRDMASVVAAIAEIEGPVHQEEVIRRVTTLWGLSRAGSRIVGAVTMAIEFALDENLISRSGDFISLLDDSEIKIRSRADVNSGNLRKPEFLPPAEIKAAILHVIESHVGIRRDEVVTATCRLFGFQSSGPQLKQVIERELGLLFDDQKIAIGNGEQVRIATDERG